MMDLTGQFFVNLFACKIIDLLYFLQYSLKVNLQILQQTIVQIEHPAVYNGESFFFIHQLNCSRFNNVGCLFNNVQFYKTVCNLAYLHFVSLER